MTNSSTHTTRPGSASVLAGFLFILATFATTFALQTIDEKNLRGYTGDMDFSSSEESYSSDEYDFSSSEEYYDEFTEYSSSIDSMYTGGTPCYSDDDCGPDCCDNGDCVVCNAYLDPCEECISMGLECDPYGGSNGEATCYDPYYDEGGDADADGDTYPSNSSIETTDECPGCDTENCFQCLTGVCSYLCTEDQTCQNNTCVSPQSCTQEECDACHDGGEECYSTSGGCVCDGIWPMPASESSSLSSTGGESSSSIFCNPDWYEDIDDCDDCPAGCEEVCGCVINSLSSTGIPGCMTDDDCTGEDECCNAGICEPSASCMGSCLSDEDCADETSNQCIEYAPGACGATIPSCDNGECTYFQTPCDCPTSSSSSSTCDVGGTCAPSTACAWDEPAGSCTMIVPIYNDACECVDSTEPCTGCEFCGNGLVENEEECDAGEDNGVLQGTECGDYVCYSDCTAPRCGDGIVNYCGHINPSGAESCDDGNNIDGDGCSADCHEEYCGDGITQPNEECEDSQQNCSEPNARCDNCSCYIPECLSNNDCSEGLCCIEEQCTSDCSGNTSDNCQICGCDCQEYNPQSICLDMVCSSPPAQLCAKQDWGSCHWIASCGNNIRELNEECDGTDLSTALKTYVQFDEIPPEEYGTITQHASDTAVGDFDGDGDTDIISVNGHFDDHTLYLNDGRGAVSNSRVLFDGAISLSQIATADFDADGDLDIVTAGDAGAFSVYMNDGSANFVASSNLVSPGSVVDCEVADMNGDDSLDFVLGTKGGNVIFFNDGTGEFSNSDTEQFGGDVHTESITLGDLDGDDDLDVVENVYMAAQQVYKNDGNGNLTLIETLDTSDMQSYDSQLVDLTNSGRFDLVVSNNNAQFLSRIYENSGGGYDPAPAFSASYEINDRTQLYNLQDKDPEAFDYNMDGYMDMILRLGPNTQYVAFINDTNGGFLETPVQISNWGLTADVDNDNFSDAISITQNTVEINNIDYYQHALQIAWNNGANIWSAPTIHPLSGALGTIIPLTFLIEQESGKYTFDDIDGDGDLDGIQVVDETIRYRKQSDIDMGLSITYGDSQQYIVMYTNTDGRNLEMSTAFSIANMAVYDVELHDFNRDGAKDLFVNDQFDGVRVYLNDGNGNFNKNEFSQLSDNSALYDLKFDYINGDEFIDVLYSGNPWSSIWYGDENGDKGYSEGFKYLGMGEDPEVNLERKPFFFETGDIDGDSDVDIVALSEANSIRIYRNDSFGNMQGEGIEHTYKIERLTDPAPIWHNYAKVMLLDVDNDTDLDLIAVHNVDDETSTYALDQKFEFIIFKNDGSGNFATEVPRPHFESFTEFGSSKNAFLEVNDYNGDSYSDIIQTSFDHDYRLYLNNGNGQFPEEHTTLADGVQHHGINSADMDGDGDMDVIFEIYGGHNKVLFNGGYEVCNACTNNCMCTSPFACGNGYLEEDEECDDENTISNDGCSATCRNEICGDGIPQTNEECDDGNEVDNDGCSNNCAFQSSCGNDIIEIGEECDGSVANELFRNTPIPFGPSFTQTRSAVLVDMDKDGDKDIVTSADNFKDAYVYLNDGNGNMNAGAIVYQEKSFMQHVEVADMDGDNDLDIVAIAELWGETNWLPPALIIYQNDGDWTFEPVTIMENAPQFDGNEFALGDLNADGMTDIVLGGDMGGENIRYMNIGNMVFSRSGPYEDIQYANTIQLADLDGDVDIDAVVRSDDRISVYVNRGNGMLDNYTTVLDDFPIGKFYLEDVNSDGYSDVIVTDYYNMNPVRIYLNNGNATFNPSYSEIPILYASAIAIDDYNADGYQDIIVSDSNSTDPKNHLYYGNNTGEFTSPSTQIGSYSAESGGTPIFITSGDLNGDARSDIVILTYGGQNEMIVSNSPGGCFECSENCTCQFSDCGNGILESGEECDDGNSVPNDSCANDCTENTNVCGDGMLNIGEQCDDGDLNSNDGCSSLCRLEYCGDGVVMSTLNEECEDDAECSTGSECTSCKCTNVITPPENCGNSHCDLTGLYGTAENCLTCPADCTSLLTVINKALAKSLGVTDADEISNFAQTDPLHILCKDSFCGDGFTDADEECDDGNTFDGDGCTSNCSLPLCGDGIVAEGLEQCDDGLTCLDMYNRPMWCLSPLSPPPGCQTPCLPLSGDGCSNCTIESGFTCALSKDQHEGYYDRSYCAKDPSATLPPENCTNGVDDDGDSAVDCDDSDCASEPSCSSCTPTEPGMEISCFDGQDNDCDAMIDCEDPECSSDPFCSGGSSSSTPSCIPDETIETKCSDGIDNDCDGYTDCSDSKCQNVGNEDADLRECADGIDNDCDSQSDCNDSDCDNATHCQGYTCGSNISGVRDAFCIGENGSCDYIPDEYYSAEELPHPLMCGQYDLEGYPCTGSCESYIEIDCRNNADDDADGYTDCGDPDCQDLPCGFAGAKCESGHCVCPGGSQREEGYDLCNDGIDNDCNGTADCEGVGNMSPDDSCSEHWESCTLNFDEDCGNGIDDDGDELIDCNDDSCSSSALCDPPDPQCANGIDDDIDGFIDMPFIEDTERTYYNGVYNGSIFTADRTNRRGFLTGPNEKIVEYDLESFTFIEERSINWHVNTSVLAIDEDREKLFAIGDDRISEIKMSEESNTMIHQLVFEDYDHLPVWNEESHELHSTGYFPASPAPSASYSSASGTIYVTMRQKYSTDWGIMEISEDAGGTTTLTEKWGLEDWPTVSSFDIPHRILYAAKHDRVDKINIDTMEVIGSLAFSDSRMYVHAMIDSVGEYAYFASANTPVEILKVRLSTMEEVDRITLSSNEQYISSGFIRSGDSLGYYTTRHGKVLVLNLDTMTLLDAHYLGEDIILTNYTDGTVAMPKITIYSSIIDSESDTAFMGGMYGDLYGRKASIMKLHLGDEDCLSRDDTSE